jgi:hypothetical protein
LIQNLLSTSNLIPRLIEGINDNILEWPERITNITDIVLKLLYHVGFDSNIWINSKFVEEGILFIFFLFILV